jgi:hypothetical protein
MCCPGDFPPRSFALAVVRKTLSRWRMLAAIAVLVLLSAVDAQAKAPDDKPTIGLLL